jgi:hypothetical protein
MFTCPGGLYPLFCHKLCLKFRLCASLLHVPEAFTHSPATKSVQNLDCAQAIYMSRRPLPPLLPQNLPKAKLMCKTFACPGGLFPLFCHNSVRIQIKSGTYVSSKRRNNLENTALQPHFPSKALYAICLEDELNTAVLFFA